MDNLSVNDTSSSDMFPLSCLLFEIKNLELNKNGFIWKKNYCSDSIPVYLQLSCKFCLSYVWSSTCWHQCSKCTRLMFLPLQVVKFIDNIFYNGRFGMVIFGSWMHSMIELRWEYSTQKFIYVGEIAIFQDQFSYFEDNLCSFVLIDHGPGYKRTWLWIDYVVGVWPRWWILFKARFF